MISSIHPIDIHVGERVRARRKALRMSQQALAAGVGLTFQQIQKYERGTNRLSASKLFEICEILEVEVGYVFTGLQTPRSDSSAGARQREAADREDLEKAVARISGPRVRRAVLDLLSDLSEGNVAA